MSIKTRNELKNAFKKGSIPKEEDFFNLIDSLSHRQEDDFWHSDEDGWKITANGISNRMISFLNNISEKSAIWSLEKDISKNDDKYALNLVNYDGESSIFIDQNCNIGIGKKDPICRLDVNGNVQSHGRKGTFASGNIQADGEWHKVISNIKDCHVFEIVAKMSKYHKGIHSIIYSIAANAFNGRHKEIKTISAYYSSYRDKIELRWTGETFSYSLEMRSKKNQGESTFVEYNISTLWW